MSNPKEETNFKISTQYHIARQPMSPLQKILHLANDCTTVAKRYNLDEDPSIPSCTQCNCPGHELQTYLFGANMETTKKTPTKHRKSSIDNYNNSKKPIRPQALNSRHSSLLN